MQDPKGQSQQKKYLPTSQTSALQRLSYQQTRSRDYGIELIAFVKKNTQSGLVMLLLQYIDAFYA
ncbi:MAG: hypothetical protein J7641_17380 [Cyanobacteria bacterium SID2]|nr:hypothetical protein [Cyanobacteria bacterium SID2]MBP0003753.1 hypothetical protein [Cyanobacteria bacterium SBC]